MDYHLTKKHLTQAAYALDSVTEQPVDVDVTLPDYCPDIDRILCCTLIPKVYLSNVSGDRLNIEGGACVRVMYTDSDGIMRSYEYTRPFSESLPIKDSPTDCAVSVHAKPEYLNCRALSPRKLSLHGSFSLYARVSVKKELEYTDCDDGGDLQIKREKLSASELCGLCDECFVVREDIPVREEIYSVLTYRVTAQLTELKAVHNKIMLNAELKPEILYLTSGEKREPACMSYSIPVSRVIECEGVDESSVIDGELSVLSAELKLNGDAIDGSGLLNLEAKLMFSALCYRESETEIISDAFSTEREVDVRVSPFSCSADAVTREYTDIGKTTVTVDESIGKVIDVHCERLSLSVTSAGEIGTGAKLCVGILFENSEGELRYAERDASFTYHPETDGRDSVMRACACVKSLSYRLTDDRTIELRAELCYRLTLCTELSCPAVSSVSADDDSPRRIGDGALVLYYADGSQSVWEIAKRYSSRPEDILAENGIEGDTVGEDMMLLIPTA